MTTGQHRNLTDFVWDIANLLRGPYRPPQYRRVMLPMIVLRRLDCVLAPTKDEVLKQYAELSKKGLSEEAIQKVLAKTAAKDRDQPLYNSSKYTFEKLIADPQNIARNLVSYIQGFSENARDIFAKFDFEKEIEKLDNADRLFQIMQKFTALDMHPDTVSNIQMGTIFEELVRRFNEQANEEAGDHFTPREVIRLMAHLMYTKDEDVYTKGVARTIYDPTCGTGGMLSESESYIRQENDSAHLGLYGQEYNPESYAICGSDLLIKDEPIDNIVFGDTLKDDGHEGEKFHYMMANPPFGVEWKIQKDVVEKERDTLGFNGRFGAGTPRINDGALLFLQHMISKMHAAPSSENGGDGSKIAIVFNGSPLFTGAAGSGESNIRRWIIENDWLDAIVALPDQMFYNTGIYTYIWLVSNRKPKQRRGKIQLIDGTKHYKKMRKSLGNKRHELSDDHIDALTRLYADNIHDQTSKVMIEDKDTKEKHEQTRICSKIFDNQDFGFLRITVERPLRLNFQASAERIERFKQTSAFLGMAKSKKRKDQAKIAEEEALGKALQDMYIGVVSDIDGGLYKNREAFSNVLDVAFKAQSIKLPPALRKALLGALSERDESADICLNKKGLPEPDKSLSDTELVPLPKDIPLPLPIGYHAKDDNSKLVALAKDHCEAYLKREVLPHVKDAWIDHKKTKVGYEIPLNRHFYVYAPPRPLSEIEADITDLEREIIAMLKDITQ